MGRFSVIDARVEQDAHGGRRLAVDREMDSIWIEQGAEGGLVAVRVFRSSCPLEHAGLQFRLKFRSRGGINRDSF